MDDLPVLRLVVEVRKNIGGEHRFGEPLFAGFRFLEMADARAEDLDTVDLCEDGPRDVLALSLCA